MIYINVVNHKHNDSYRHECVEYDSFIKCHTKYKGF